MSNYKEDFLKKIRQHQPLYNWKLIEEATQIGDEAHKGQNRLTGEPFFTHPVAVATILVELEADQSTIVAALLHDTLEDTDLDPKVIEGKFGSIVLKLVQGVTNLRRTELVKSGDQDLQNVKKLIMASTDDLRVIIIKLADRMHNARTIEGLKPERRITYAKEILDIFAPLSEYLGIGKFVSEFQDIAFRNINPGEYNRTKSNLEKLKGESTDSIEMLAHEIGDIVSESGIRSDVISREKGVYSTYKKINKYKREGMSDAETKHITDRLAIRIIVESVENCYQVLGLVHQRWSFIKEEFDDYISNPKPNGYKSLHTVIETKRWGSVEIQIRTKEMHEVAEYGAAAHTAYKASEKRNTNPTQAFNWIKNLIWNKEITDDESKYKMDLFSDRIFVFTPQNKLIELPKGSTAVDFAYRIHTNVGNNCIGTIINKEMVSLDTKLKTNDQVEILVSKAKRYPSADWLNFVKTPSAKSHIRRALRDKMHDDAISKGKEKLTFAINSQKNLNETEIEKLLNENINKIRVRDVAEAYERIGHGLITEESVIASIFPKSDKEKFAFKTKQKEIKSKAEVSIEGQTGIKIAIAKCCNPSESDDIVALITSQNEAKIHKTTCLHILGRKDDSRVFRANWE